MLDEKAEVDETVVEVDAAQVEKGRNRPQSRPMQQQQQPQTNYQEEER